MEDNTAEKKQRATKSRSSEWRKHLDKWSLVSSIARREANKRQLLALGREGGGMKTFWKILFTVPTFVITIIVSWGLYFVVGEYASLVGVFGGLVCFIIWDN